MVTGLSLSQALGLALPILAASHGEQSAPVLEMSYFIQQSELWKRRTGSRRCSSKIIAHANGKPSTFSYITQLLWKRRTGNRRCSSKIIAHANGKPSTFSYITQLLWKKINGQQEM
ncbi:hypothetical protein PoB_001696900 [Plakobranchus ocellatus]|uniref:Secreted protein n=1 Tax=Plakobranchus ocellatus TaxID=259542 RepID=A0AAV3Z592_9GAST|nr:hypothetical protein PoB_001696900 [Plakobranchus ocellatus]